MIELYGSGLFVESGDFIKNEDGDILRVEANVDLDHFAGFWVNDDYGTTSLRKGYKHWQFVKYLKTPLYKKLAGIE